jgi:CTP:molybdopterin cytidylyltransferase MocA
MGTTSLADSKIPVTGFNGDLPGPAGDAGAGERALGAIILDGFDRAYALNLASTLRRAEVEHPLARALQNDVKLAGASAGPISIAITVNERHDLVAGYSIDQPGIGPEAVARVLGAYEDERTLVSAAYDGVRGHPVLFGAAHWAGIAATAAGDRGARAYLKEHAEAVTLVECGDVARPFDIDTPQDLAHLE